MLYTAVKHGRKEIVKLLLDHGVDVNEVQVEFDDNILYKAVESGEEQIVKMLLVEPSAKNYQYPSPI